MKPKYTYIFFDLDGTISDSILGIENGLIYALQKSDIKVVDSHIVKEMVGLPLDISLEKYFFSDKEIIDKVITDFRKYYKEKGVFESKLYPGIKDLLKELSKISYLFIVTAKPTIYAEKILEYHEIRTFFTNVYGCQLEEKNFKKSHILRQFDSLSSVMIGDKLQDINAGKEVGMATIGVKYGYGLFDEFEEVTPDFLAKNISDLKAILL